MIHDSPPVVSVHGESETQVGDHSPPRQHRDSGLVLVMEDDDDCLLVTIYTLELLGYQCLSTQDSQAAVNLARAQDPDLFLLDIVMPNQDGVEVFRQLRQIPKFRQCPMIAVTALAMEREREQILSVGFDDFLSKPFFLQDLARVMHRHLPSHHQNLEQDLQVFEPEAIPVLPDSMEGTRGKAGSEGDLSHNRIICH